MCDENLFFSRSMFAIDLILFELLKNILYFLMSFGSFVVSGSLFDLLADCLSLGPCFFCPSFSSFDQNLELLVFAVDRFFFARSH